jgi:hypothetical protein
MAFALPALWFLVVAIVDVIVGVASLMRWSAGRKDNQRWERQFARMLVGVMAIGAGGDSLYMFGGGWAHEEPPWYAFANYPLVTLHLVMVPLLIIAYTEILCSIRGWKAREDGLLADADSVWETRARTFAFVFASTLAVIGFVNTVASWQSTGLHGMERNDKAGGLVVWRLQELEKAVEDGFLTIGIKLAGVIAFAIWAVLCGVCIWRRTGFSMWFWVALACFLGQAGGVALGDAFSYLSNFLEIGSFAPFVYADMIFMDLKVDR